MFVSRVSSNRQGNAEEEEESIDYQTLNEKQRIVFERIESHYNSILAGHPVEPLRIIVMGTAGTGKTYLIRGIKGRLREMAGIGSKSPVLVLAPTGVAAFNIKGTTIHSTLSIPIITNNKCLDLNGERLKQLQDKFQDVKYIIVDEKSMVGR
jgi:Ni2+-binding GTPase involved in maturation of urease and hydrogenase